MAQTRKKQQAWSYIAGKKGTNRVRAYEEADGRLYLEWQEPVFDNQGLPVVDPRTKLQQKKRQRLSLSASGITTYSAAMKKAEETAERFGEMGPGAAAPKFNGPLTLKRLLTLYLSEALAIKAPDTQRQNKTTARMFLNYFGANAVVERIGANGRPQTDLGRVRYNAFLKAREQGLIPEFPKKVRKQTILNDYRFLRSVFAWAKVERDDGTVLLLRDPWEGFPPPREDTPVRPEMTKELHELLVEKAVNWRMAEVMELCRETRRRMNSVRQLQVSDVDLAARTVRWRGEFDKARKTRVTPLSFRALAALKRVLEQRRIEGSEESPWLFPAQRTPSEPVSRPCMHHWMRQTKKENGINIPRLGYHGEKRAGIRDPKFRALPAPVQEELAGTTYGTITRVYEYVDLPALFDAVAVLEGGAPASTAPPPGPMEELPRAA
ncbi:MAG: Phage integrase family protein [Gemmatimonadetes bacterium]|nr:Phage integrase family protein [Gemmatimonadota bacterium]